MVYNVYGLGFKGLLIPLGAVPNFRLRLIVLEAPLQPIFRLYGWPCKFLSGTLKPSKENTKDLGPEVLQSGCSSDARLL